MTKKKGKDKSAGEPNGQAPEESQDIQDDATEEGGAPGSVSGQASEEVNESDSSTPEDGEAGNQGVVVPAGSGDLTASDKDSINVQVPAAALEQAVTQLQRLTALREREAERQEAAIGDMQAAIQKQGVMSRWLVAMSLLVTAGVIATVVVLMHLRTANELAGQDLQALNGTVNDARRVVQEASEKQSQGLSEVSREVSAVRAGQDDMTTKVISGVAETREIVTKEVGRQTEALAAVQDQMTETKQVLQEEAVATKDVVERGLAASQQAVRTEVAKVGDELKVTREAMTREVGKQAAATNQAIKQEVVASQQAVRTEVAKVSDALKATREAMALEVGKQAAATNQAIKQEVATTQQAVRTEVAKVGDALKATRQAAVLEAGKQAAALSSVTQAVAASRSDQAKQNEQTRETIARTVSEITAKQEAAIETVKQEVGVARDAQTEELVKVRSEMAAARNDSANLSKLVDTRMSETQASIAAQLEDSIVALKEERDRVQAEVKRLLEEKMELLTARELKLQGAEEKLRAEEARVGKLAEEAQAARDIISQALGQLTGMKQPPRTGTEVLADPESSPGTAKETGSEDPPPPIRADAAADGEVVQ